MKVAVLGDNCIDRYDRIDREYVTGNAVDTAVHLKRMGIPTAIITTTGTDLRGEWVRKTLELERLDTSHVKIAEGSTAVTYMSLDGTERIHGEYLEGVLEKMLFDEDDLHFAIQHDWVHTAFWGKADHLLEFLNKSGCRISFDYATNLNDEMVKRTAPFVDCGFFSYREHDAYIEAYLQKQVENGMRIAICTLGEHGSLAYDGKQFYQYGVIPARVVNTIGAGDSFIAGFLSQMMRQKSIVEGLACGARVASRVIEVFEPWELEKE